MSPRKAAVLRDSGGQNLREHMIAAAERLISRRGTAGLTVRDIAREAQVADGVLYNHFADKEELLAYALHAHAQTVERTLGTPPGPAGAGTIEDNLRGYVARNLALHTALLPALVGLLNQPKAITRFAGLPNPVVAGRGLRAELSDYLRAEQELGRLAPDANAEAAAMMITGACHDLILPNLFNGTPPNAIKIPSNFVDDLVAIVLSGIGQRTGRGR